jgi:hypothetical protein
LLLCGVQSHTNLLLILLYLLATRFRLLELKLELLLSLEVLLLEFLLEIGVKWVISCQKLKILLLPGVSH